MAPCAAPCTSHSTMANSSSQAPQSAGPPRSARPATQRLRTYRARERGSAGRRAPRPPGSPARAGSPRSPGLACAGSAGPEAGCRSREAGAGHPAPRRRRTARRRARRTRERCAAGSGRARRADRGWGGSPSWRPSSRGDHLRVRGVADQEPQIPGPEHLVDQPGDAGQHDGGVDAEAVGYARLLSGFDPGRKRGAPGRRDGCILGT